MGQRGMTMNRRARARLTAVAGIVALLLGACGSGPTGTPDAPSTVPASATGPTSSAPTTRASAAPVPATTPSVEPGLIVDRSFAWGTIAWSSSGDTLAAAALTQQLGQGEIHLFERTGRQAGVVPGIDLAWVDDDHLVAVQRNSDGVSSSARLWSKDAREAQLLSSRMASILGNGRGAVAVLFDSQDATQATYRIWAAGVLSKVWRGIPVAWSGDGRLLVVEHDPEEGSIDRLIAGGSTNELTAGGSIPAWYEVIGYPTMRRLAVFRDVRVDGRIRPAFDAAGSRLAAIGDNGRAVVLGLAPRSTIAIKLRANVLGWTLDGRLALEASSPHGIRLWDPATGTLGAPLAPGIRFATTDGQIVTVPDPSTDPSPEVKTTGALNPGGSIRARFGPAIDDETLRLLTEPAVPAAP